MTENSKRLMTARTDTQPTAAPSRPAKIILRAWFALSGAYTAGLLLYLLLRVLVGNGLWWLSLAHNFAPLLFAPLIVMLPLTLIFMRDNRISNRLKRAALTGQLIGVIVGLLWFGPYFLPKASAEITGPELTVVTFNIFPYNDRLDEVVAWLAEQDADVVFLQEIQPGETDTALAGLDYPYIMMQSYKNGGMILSRYPIITSQELPLSAAWFGENWAVQYAIINIDGQKAALYNIHLMMPHQEYPHISPPFLPDFITRYDVTGRDQQISELLAYLAEQTLPTIVSGDFNMSDHAVAYNRLAAQLGDSFREAGQGFGWSWPAGASEEMDDLLPPLVRLDYVWHSRDITAIDAAIGPKLGSDHLPLVVRLALPEPTAR